MKLNKILVTGILLFILGSNSFGQDLRIGWSGFSVGFNKVKNNSLLLTSVMGESFTGRTSKGNSVITSGFLVYSESVLTDLENEKEFIPVRYELRQNYPNPFNPSTKITFTIPGKSRVTLKVYNLLGSEVALLADGEMEAGKYSVDFNAEGLASGVYFYTLQSGDFTQTKKMIILK